MESFLHTVGTSFCHCDRLQTACRQPHGTSAAEGLDFIPDNWLLNNLTAFCRVYVMRSQKAAPHEMDLINTGTARSLLCTDAWWSSASFLLLSSLTYVVVTFWDGDPKFMTLSEFYRRPSLITRSAVREPVSQCDRQFRPKTKGVPTFLSWWLFFCLRQPKIAKCVSKKLKKYPFFHVQGQKNNRVYLKPRRSPLKLQKAARRRHKHLHF